MPSRDRWVYVAADEDGRHKIGCTGNLDLRMYHLGRDLGFKRVTLVHSTKLDDVADAAENLAHWSLAERPNCREWFSVRAEDAIAAVDAAAARALAGERITSRFAVEKRLTIRDDLNARMAEALAPGKSRQRFMEAAVEAELKRREK